MLAFCALDRLFHLYPVKPIVAEEAAIFHLPDAIEKIVGHFVEWNPLVLNIAAIPLGDHGLEPPNNHQRSDRRVEKTDVDCLQDWDKR